LPKTGPLTYVKDFWGLFRRITDQWGTVPLAKQPFAYWNGIAREWVVVSAVTDPAGSGGTPDDKKARARREYEEALRYLKSLREANPALLTAEQFDKEVAELGDRYRERI
jgi:hypothetical protein